ncbi:MAG: hypothetical protein ACE5GB_03485 [Acidimicrobiales bacterium]
MDLQAKLNIGSGSTVLVSGVPSDVELDLGDTTLVRVDSRTVPAAGSDADAVIVFAVDRAELAGRSDPLIECALADRVAWLAYPKGGQLGTDLNRDLVNDALAPAGLRPVRQVAIDSTWSALRFRPGQLREP